MGACTFQNIRLFKDLTAIENVEIAYHNFVNYNLAPGPLPHQKVLEGRAEGL